LSYGAGILGWVEIGLGAWLVKSVLDLVLRRAVFPDDNEPHARRLFADLVSALMSRDTHQYGFILGAAAADWPKSPTAGGKPRPFAMIKNILIPLRGSDTDAAVFATALWRGIARGSAGSFRAVGLAWHCGAGSYGRRGFGGVTQSLLESANLPVLMTH